MFFCYLDAVATSTCTPMETAKPRETAVVKNASDKSGSVGTKARASSSNKLPGVQLSTASASNKSSTTAHETKASAANKSSAVSKPTANTTTKSHTVPAKKQPTASTSNSHKSDDTSRPIASNSKTAGSSEKNQNNRQPLFASPARVEVEKGASQSPVSQPPLEQVIDSGKKQLRCTYLCMYVHCTMCMDWKGRVR